MEKTKHEEYTRNGRISRKDIEAWISKNGSMACAREMTNLCNEIAEHVKAVSKICSEHPECLAFFNVRVDFTMKVDEDKVIDLQIATDENYKPSAEDVVEVLLAHLKQGLGEQE